MATCPVLLSSGVDYLTVTTTQSKWSDPLRLRCSEIFRTEHERGNVVRGWGMAGFSGFKVGQIQIGQRDQEAIVRISSNLAQRQWREVFELAQNATRLDLQVTIRWAQPASRVLKRNHRAALAHARQFKRPPTVRYIAGNDGGQTVYLGSRQSNKFGRAYDKGVESGLVEFENSVRYEVQYQGALAQLVANKLFSLSSPSPAIIGRVAQFFNSRGVPLPGLIEDGQHECCRKIPSDFDRSLLWLRESVSPCIRRLIVAGKRDEVLLALGL